MDAAATELRLCPIVTAHASEDGKRFGNALGGYYSDSNSSSSGSPPHGNTALSSSEHFLDEDFFRMYEFKVKKCPCNRPHDWTKCPFTHPGERARRRDPRKFNYSATPCPDFKRDACTRGDACGFAHGTSRTPRCLSQDDIIKPRRHHLSHHPSDSRSHVHVYLEPGRFR